MTARLLVLNNQGLAGVGGGPTILRHVVEGLAQQYRTTVASWDMAAPGFAAVEQVRLEAPTAPGRWWRIAPVRRAWHWRNSLPPALIRSADLVIVLDVHAGLAMARLRPRRLLYVSLSSAPLQEAAMGLGRFGVWQYARLERLLAKHAATTLVSSHAHRAALRRNAGPVRIAVLHPALPGPELPHAEGPVTILAAGRLVRGKCFHVIIDLAERLRDLPCRWIFAGDGPERAALQARALAAGLANRVAFVGAVPDIGPLLAQSHLLVHPSRYESFGMAVFEAARAGRPVLFGPDAGVREVLPKDCVVDFAAMMPVEARLRRLILDAPHRADLATRTRLAAEAALATPYLDGIRGVIGRLLAA